MGPICSADQPKRRKAELHQAHSFTCPVGPRQRAPACPDRWSPAKDMPIELLPSGQPVLFRSAAVGATAKREERIT